MGALAFPFPFVEASAEFQKHPEAVSVFPLVLVPAEGANDLSAVADAIQLHRDWVDDQLLKHGAILLRGFPVSSAQDFSTIVEAFGWDEFDYIGGGGFAVRSRIHGKVLSVNENIPLDKDIAFHNEATYLEKPPTRLIFFCEDPPPPGAGGSTPLLFGNSVYQRVITEPDLLEQLVKRGPINLVTILSKEEWQKKFGTDDKDIAEERIIKTSRGLKPEWMDDGGWQKKFGTDDKDIAEERIIKTSRGLKPEWMDDGGVKLSFSKFGTEVFKEDRAGRMAVYGSWAFMGFAFKVEFQFTDGSKVPEETMNKLVKIMREEEVSFPWEKGDIVLVDNTAVQHSRQSCTSSTRVIRISLTI